MDQGTTYVEPVVKSQPVRVLDMFVIGPLMIAGAVAAYHRSPIVAVPLVFFGVTTIVYNAVNYTKVHELEKENAA